MVKEKKSASAALPAVLPFATLKPRTDDVETSVAPKDASIRLEKKPESAPKAEDTSIDRDAKADDEAGDAAVVPSDPNAPKEPVELFPRRRR